jgi:translation initiation factor IF-2
VTEQSQPTESTEDAAEEASGAPAMPPEDVPADDAPADDTPAPIETAPEPPPVSAAPPPPLPPVSPPELSGAGAAAQRPEIAVGAAFAGGFVFAMILRRLAR